MSRMRIHIKGCGGEVGQKLFEKSMRRQLGSGASISYDWSSGACEIPVGYARLLEALEPRVVAPTNNCDADQSDPTQQTEQTHQRKLV